MVAGIVGMAILDSLIVDTTNAKHITNESLVLDNGTAVSLSQDDVVATSETVFADSEFLVRDTNYTIDNTLGQITLIDANYDGNTSLVTYNYYSDEYLSGGISRTIIAYVVPIGLLSLLGIIGYAGFKS